MTRHASAWVRRIAVPITVVAALAAVGGCSQAKSSGVSIPTGTTGTTPAASAGASVSTGTGTGTGTGGPSTVVAVRMPEKIPPEEYTPADALVLLDPTSGKVTRELVSKGVTGPQVALSPDGQTVYYEKPDGCVDEIMSVPVAGGTPKLIAHGSLPAISPDGARLAYAVAARQPHCLHDENPGARYAVVSRDLATGAEKRLGLSKDRQIDPPAAEQLSWSPDGSKILVTFAGKDYEENNLNIVDPTHDTYYSVKETPSPKTGTFVPSGGKGAPAARDWGFPYFAAGTYLPNGDLLVVHACCTGRRGTSEARVSIVKADSGDLVRTLATVATPADTTSPVSDKTGRWLAYVTGSTIMISGDGGTPKTLAKGYQAVTW